MKTPLYAALLAGALLPALPARADMQWLEGRGRSCELVCLKGGYKPVAAGDWAPGGKKSDKPYYVCAGQKDGPRPGYNLLPHWANVCMVAFGGKELRIPDYTCLCADQ